MEPVQFDERIENVFVCHVPIEVEAVVEIVGPLTVGAHGVAEGAVGQHSAEQQAGTGEAEERVGHSAI